MRGGELLDVKPEKGGRTMETPADQLKRARKEKGFESAADAADRLGVPRSSYQNYEDGARGYSRHLMKFALFYGVRAEWLATGQLPMRLADLEEKFNALAPADQAKVIIEYIDMLAMKSQD